VLAAYRALRGDDPALRAHAVELLDNLIEQPLRRRVTEALEVKPPEDAAPLDAGEQHEILYDLCDDGDLWVRACADYILEEDDAKERDHAHDHREDAAASGHPSAPRPAD
jgi:hypothetical protein